MLASVLSRRGGKATMSTKGGLSPLEQWRESFNALGDPRVERTAPTTRHYHYCHVCCHLRADDWVEIEQFGNDKRTFFDKLLILPNGVPSHDTSRNVLT
jgi:hypothetical protein